MYTLTMTPMNGDGFGKGVGMRFVYMSLNDVPGITMSLRYHRACQIAQRSARNRARLARDFYLSGAVFLPDDVLSWPARHVGF